MSESDDGFEFNEMAGFYHSVGFVDDEKLDVSDRVGDVFVLGGWVGVENGRESQLETKREERDLKRDSPLQSSPKVDQA